VHEKRIEIRWRDLDPSNHVNNAVFLTYLEEARDEWLAERLGAGWDYLLARVAIDFRREITQADEEVVARCSLARIGVSSVTTREEIYASGELAAEAEAIVVARDRDSGGSRPIDERERVALEREP
jgi:acyl-CoA thioester hydrolase